MEKIFELIIDTDKEKKDKISASIGIPLKVGGHETTCSVSRLCNSYEVLETEVQAIKNNLDSLLAKAKEIFQKNVTEEGLDLSPDMEPEQIWEILSDILDEGLFVKRFNDLGEDKRREVAEHVLTRCNIFSGRASVFSSRYDNEKALME